MFRWTRQVAVVVAWCLSLTQVAPVVSASTNMRQSGSVASGETGREIRGDRNWLYGAAGANLQEIGGANLEAAGKRMTAEGFADGRVAPLAGPGARPVADLASAYARGFERTTGMPLSDQQQQQVAARMDRVREEIESIVAEINVPVNVPGYQAIAAAKLVRVAPILDHTGRPSLLPEDVMGHSITHAALASRGGRHRYAGWEDAVAEFQLDAAARDAIGHISIYPSFELVERLLAKGKRDTVRLILGHEIRDALRGYHLDEPAVVTNQVNADIRDVLDEFSQERQARLTQQNEARKAQARKAAEKLVKRVQLVPYVVSLGRFFEGGTVPGFAMATLQTKLDKAIGDKTIVDALVKRFGGALLLEVHYNGPQRNAEVDRLIVDAVSATLDASAALAAENVEAKPIMTGTYEKEMRGKSYSERAQALRIRTGEFAFNERGAEPLYVSVALGGGPAAFNWVVMRLLDEAVQNQLKIEGIREEEIKTLRKEYDKYREAVQRGDTVLAKDLEFNAADLARQAEQEGPGYVVVVESVADILAGKRERRGFQFVYPTHAPYIHTLVDDQTEYVITKVLSRAGSRLYDVSKAPADQDPMLSIMVDSIGEGAQSQESFNPVFVARQQSGAPAIGEFVSATTQFYLTTSGTGAGTTHRGVIPATFAEADAGTFAKDGLVQMVSYTYQSYDNGKIPHSEVHDQVDLSTDVKATRNDEVSVHDDLMLLGSFQPAVTAPEANRRAERVVETLGTRYHEVPAVIALGADGKPLIGPDGKPAVKLDPILEVSNAGQVLTVSDLKADIGATGHQLPYNVYYAAFRASLNVAKAQGLIDNYDVANAGDDNHFVMFHKRGVDSSDIHGLAWNTFFRAGWVAQQLGYKTYGFMQDLVDPKVVKLIKDGKLYTYANLNDEFMAALETELQGLPEAAQIAKIRQGYENFKQGKETGQMTELARPGNVTGMGIGFAEKAVSASELARVPSWSVVANDKGAAGAFNYPAYWSTRIALLISQGLSGAKLRAALLKDVDQKMPDVPTAKRAAMVEKVIREVELKLGQSEKAALSEVAKNGLVFETWEVLPNSRAFIDAGSEDATLLTLLSAANEHNIKRIWTKKRAGWIGDLSADEVAAIEERVDVEMPAIREQIIQRKARLEQDVSAHAADPKTGRSVETLNPWERRTLESPVQFMADYIRPRLVELYKVREFLGDDYIAAISTEKLAAVTGGEYVGKDDSVMIAIEPFGALHRAITKHVVRVNIGNARGSHWVAMRPEGNASRVPGQLSTETVAVKWSNPIEIALRYQVGQDGVVVADPATGLAFGDDQYGASEYSQIRDRVIHFNEMWISAQGGFTPHGPNVMRDVEAAYPARKTLNRIIAEGSPFEIEVTDETLAAVDQGQLVEQFPDADYTISPEVAAQAADLANPRWVVIHSSVFSDSEAPAIVLARIRRQLGQVLGPGQRALRFALAVDGATSAEQAQQKGSALLAAISSGSAERARVLFETFDGVLPAAVEPGRFLGLAEALAPGSTLGGVYGPESWANSLKQASAKPDEVLAVAYESSQTPGKVAAGDSGLIAVVEGAAAGGKLPPALAAKLKLLQEGAIVRVEQLDVRPDAEPAIRSYQTTVGNV